MNPDWLAEQLSTRAYLWRLERRDGMTIGFTSHDRDLVIDELRYRAAPGLIPSSIALSDSLDIDNVEIEAVMTASAITETDLVAGRWNGAQLSISLANWEVPDDPVLPLIRGEFGEILRSGSRFSVELLGPTGFLDAAIAPVTSPTCRAFFGDRQCKVSLHRFQAETTITATYEDHIECGGLGGDAQRFALGEIRFLGGPNCGLQSSVIRGAGNLLWLGEMPSRPLSAGTRILLTEGCDRSFATCRDRFANGLNFRGEPHLPGNDLLTRYPGA